MKKLHALLFVALIGFVGNAQVVNIPNANFKAKLLSASTSNSVASTESPVYNALYGMWSANSYTKIDTDNDGQISTSEALAIKCLNVSSGNISDLTGIQSFTNLQLLNCNINQLTSLNISNLTNLQVLSCTDNQLPSLNVSGLTNLVYLNCHYNQLPSLNVSGLTNLERLDCNNNLLPSLNLNGLINLHYLDCSGNHLPSLDVSGLINLQNLYCSSNQLPSLNVSGLTNITDLNCRGNQLSNLDVSDLTNLYGLDFTSNQLTTLDVSGLSNLHYLNCYSNQLISLFLKNGSIESNLNINGNPNLHYICADEGQIASIQTQITQNGYNCHVNSYCSFTPGGTFYTIQGNNRYDSNSDGCDVSDINYPNLRLSFTYGTTTGNFIGNSSGNYFIPVGAGTFTMAPVLENPTYFSISPTTATVTFPTATSPFPQDFCITANGTHNDLEVTLFPITSARPGFDAKYKIIYKNKGTSAQSGTVSFNYYDPIEDFVTSTPNFDSQATNTLNWNFSNLMPFESREITVTLNINSTTETPPVFAGYGIIYTATVTGATDETSNDNVFNFNQIVVNSFDPNDKTCTEGNNLPVNEVGKYLHYIIRFENNGTANAENIVVKDIIDTTKFDINTLIPLSGSHPFETKISATNNVDFIFQNINLPFDDANNDGYVAFKIKTLPTITDGQTITNSASIYFDYNAPVVTNTNIVHVFNPLATPDFDFGSVFTLSPVPAKNSLTISTKQDVTISSVNIYNALGQLVQVDTNPNQTIDVSGLKTGNYFIKIISNKGSAGSKFIKE